MFWSSLWNKIQNGRLCIFFWPTGLWWSVVSTESRCDSPPTSTTNCVVSTDRLTLKTASPSKRRVFKTTHRTHVGIHVRMLSYAHQVPGRQPVRSGGRATIVPLLRRAGHEGHIQHHAGPQRVVDVGQQHAPNSDDPNVRESWTRHIFK